MADHERPQPRRADTDLLAGVGRALGQAFPASGALGPDIQAGLDRLADRYRPDAAADARFEHLLERLKRLPWDGDGGSARAVKSRGAGGA